MKIVDDEDSHSSIPGTEESFLYVHKSYYSGLGNVKINATKMKSQGAASHHGGLESILDEDDEQCKVPTKTCEECGRDDSNGWESYGQYWCATCWEKWHAEKVSKWFSKQSDIVPNGAMTLQKYDNMEDPICLQGEPPF